MESRHSYEEKMKPTTLKKMWHFHFAIANFVIGASSSQIQLAAHEDNTIYFSPTDACNKMCPMPEAFRSLVQARI